MTNKSKSKMGRKGILLIGILLVVSLISAGVFVGDENVFGLNLEKVLDFQLEQISDIFSEIESGELNADGLVFLDEDGNEIKIEGIEKVDYGGKIYDVDVGNDVVLVRRRNDVINSNTRSLPIGSKFDVGSSRT